ncbi:TetR/AcrR family transcriptional regulator [Aestuariicella hydrocarbonica]|uniref:TetR/AcrR family transcriptional regulator n=1 Tax=Pseudomaricurvus hydrocarbonicus TaxID=1470433 RepID=A0A9E5MKZ7_9GAMM|nr:TetR/AcrR family transcriptional regulator [Aestuariicella hydrocarbonica]NHO66112.1 TetR/AcrR family transcriptional regulator [Aestuariicella hydrocarbonica]
MSSQRRSQAERRQQTYNQVLESATQLFGERGYDGTSLEDIAVACGLTTRPIYHYFGNKKALFAAVNEQQEQRILASMDASADVMSSWRSFLGLCDEAGFRRIVLLDSPNVLGRDRWGNSEVAQASLKFLVADATQSKSQRIRQTLISRVLIAAFGECALMIAQADDTQMAKREADRLVQSLVQAFIG